MKRVIATVALILGFAPCLGVEERRSKNLALPNPKLLRRRASVGSQLWPGDASPNAIRDK